MQPSYPFVINPYHFTNKACSISYGKSHKKGQSELVAYANIISLGLKDVKGNARVTIDGHSYEPDFAIIDKEGRYCIDIEIDEPYSSGGRPTHFMMPDGSNKDTFRNRRFSQAGWYVIRFSEEQFMTKTKSCMYFVYNLLFQKGLIEGIPQTLVDASNIDYQARWTESDSRQLRRNNYRDSYLLYNPNNMGIRGYVVCSLRIVPIIWNSFFDKTLRNDLIKQLYDFFIKRKISR